MTGVIIIIKPLKLAFSAKGFSKKIEDDFSRLGEDRVIKKLKIYLKETKVIRKKKIRSISLEDLNRLTRTESENMRGTFQNLSSRISSDGYENSSSRAEEVDSAFYEDTGSNADSRQTATNWSRGLISPEVEEGSAGQGTKVRFGSTKSKRGGGSIRKIPGLTEEQKQDEPKHRVGREEGSNEFKKSDKSAFSNEQDERRGRGSDEDGGSSDSGDDKRKGRKEFENGSEYIKKILEFWAKIRRLARTRLMSWWSSSTLNTMHQRYGTGYAFYPSWENIYILNLSSPQEAFVFSLLLSTFAANVAYRRLFMRTATRNAFQGRNVTNLYRQFERLLSLARLNVNREWSNRIRLGVFNNGIIRLGRMYTAGPILTIWNYLREVARDNINRARERGSNNSNNKKD
jgi:hypothetical protein